MTIQVRSANRVYLCSECGYVIGKGSVYGTLGKKKLCRECVRGSLARREGLGSTPVKASTSSLSFSKTLSSSANPKVNRG